MDFIKNKIVYRTILSSIGPIILYSTGFLGYKLLKATSMLDSSAEFTYGNSYAWLTILAFAILYPLNQFSLWLFFKPIEFFIDRK